MLDTLCLTGDVAWARLSAAGESTPTPLTSAAPIAIYLREHAGFWLMPLDVTLLVEGRIKPQDIAFIRPSQDAVVKISAYDSNVYGSLK